MKKITALGLSILLFAGILAGCASTPTDDPAPPVTPPADNQPADIDSRVLIVYYSLSGNTENVAKMIETKTGADLYLLEPETPYPSSTEATGTEMQAERDNNSIRELTGTLPDLSDYDYILIGGPVWSGLPSNPVQKYLSLNDFTGKQVSGFWTAYGDPANYADEFAALVTNGSVLEGLSLVSADVSDSAVLNAKIDAWLESLGLPQASGSAAAADITVRKFDSTGPRAWTASFHVISSEKGNILIDPGKYDDELAEYIESIGGVEAILITHGHWDKLRGLDEAVAANPDATVYVHELDYPYFSDPVRNCSIEQGFEGITETPAETLVEGTYQIAGYTVEVIHTPGHTEGSSLFYFPDENMLIGGDTIMADLVAGSEHPGGNEADRQASIQKFKELVFPDDMKIYSGHGADTTYAELMQTNRDLQ